MMGGGESCKALGRLHACGLSSSALLSYIIFTFYIYDDRKVVESMIVILNLKIEGNTGDIGRWQVFHSSCGV